MQPKFIHLHLHSEYSVCDSLVRIKPLLQRSISLGMPAIALTDQSNFFAVIKFYKAALSLGLKPIIGVDFYVKPIASAKNQEISQIVLLAQNYLGYQNLLKLISKTHLSSENTDTPLLSRDWLFGLNEGLLALSSAQFGDIGQALLKEDFETAEENLIFWQKIFPDRFYLELQRVGRSDEEAYIKAAIHLAEKTNTPVVATNDVRFIEKDDFEAHEARVCIHQGYTLSDSNRPRNYTENQYLQSPEEMCSLFADIPEAIENTIEIAKRCNVEIPLYKTFLPIFPLPENITSIEDYFEKQARSSLESYLAEIFTESATPPRYPREVYLERLNHEIGVIKQMGFASYFLIVADFIRWSRENNIPVGPGRGSGAGSLIAFSLKITDLDPLEHELLFERFLNPERVSLPDFDIDFCMDGRDSVISYVFDRYGRDRVAQIVTHGTMAAKAVVRDVGRVLAHPYGFVDKIAKLIPFAIGITLQEAMEQEPLLKERYNTDEEVKTLINLALKIEGLVRNVGKHAGGIVIAPTALTDFTPLYCDPDNKEGVITQFDKDDIETIGLVKFDFLGLRTLTIIAKTIESINAKRALQNEDLLNIAKLSLDDIKTFDLIKSGATTAVFQIESRGMKELIARLQPDCFNNIVALVALYRPGPLQSGMVDDFVDRKHGRAQIIYPHPSLEPILKPTYGVILYQEQVMQIAQILSGYTLGGADILRRAMGKKKPEEMAKQRAIFIEGAASRGVDKHIANSIFDLMEKFAGYGFNRSHSAAYALLTYHTAWLKSHYPAEFMAAVLSADMDNTDKVVKLIVECKRMGIKIIPPNINSSDYEFRATQDGNIVFGLGAIKGAGEAAIENIIEERKNGKFKTLFDLCKRSDKRKLNRKVLEALVKSGSVDSIGPNRASIFASLNKAMQMAEQNAQNTARKQLSLFSDEALWEDEDGEKEQSISHYVSTPDWSQEEQLSGEKNTLGFYLSGHPFDKYSPELSRFTTSLDDLAEMQKQNVVTAGIITSLRQILTKSNKIMAVISLESSTANVEAVVFSDLFNEKRSLLAVDQLVIIEGEVDIDNFNGSPRLRSRDILTLDHAREKYARLISIKLDKTINEEFLKQTLPNLLKPYLGGPCPVCIDYQNETATAKILLGDKWRVKAKSELINALREVLGNDKVEVGYS